jgi:uncharacterized protein (DUF4415 family)
MPTITTSFGEHKLAVAGQHLERFEPLDYLGHERNVGFFTGLVRRGRQMPDRGHAKRAKDVPNLARIQKKNEGKERITIRIDADVLAWFRAQVKGGGNYQTLINDTLRAAMNADDAPLTVRRLRDVLRQEFRGR